MRRAWEIAVAVVVVAVLVVIAGYAFTDPSPRDLNAYYPGATGAWARGDPWSTTYWSGMPGTILLLSPLTRVLSISQFAWAVTFTNLLLAVALAAAAFVWLRARASSWFAGLVVMALVAFAPLAGTFWWKQLNLLVFALAVGAFIVVGRRAGLAGALLGVSIAVKPLAILVPLFWLAKRETRRAGAISVASAVGFTAAGLALLGWRGGSADPLEYFRLLDDRVGKPTVGSLVCNSANTSPTGLACRVFGSGHWTVTRLLVLAGVALLVVMAIALLRGIPGTELGVFAWGCLLSLMVGGLGWFHYGIFLTPMFLVIIATLWHAPRAVELWFGVAASYALSQLVWSPAMSLPGQFRMWLYGTAETASELDRVMVIGALTGFVLVIAAVRAATLHGVGQQ